MKHKKLLLTILLLAGVIVSGCGPSAGPTATITIATETARPTELPTVLPSDTPKPAPVATGTPTPAKGSTRVSPKDGMQMVYIPAGDFKMGSLAGVANEQPVHTVYLDGYWIDRTEVTNDMYSKCVQAGACLRPYRNGSNTHVDYYSNPLFATYPVIDLRWTSVVQYCAWVDRRLPTEAEWEKAARGTDGRTYPWGNENPSDRLLNFNKPLGDASAVGLYPYGASPYGALDMAGNVREWVADWYDSGYYRVSPDSNPTGPITGVYKVVRGGSWHSDVYLVQSAERFYLAPDTRDITVGFRCAMPAR